MASQTCQKTVAELNATVCETRYEPSAACDHEFECVSIEDMDAPRVRRFGKAWVVPRDYR